MKLAKRLCQSKRKVYGSRQPKMDEAHTHYRGRGFEYDERFIVEFIGSPGFDSR